MSVIPFDKRKGVLWFNDQIMDWEDAKIHILNHGLNYGSSIYEGIRIYNHKPFKLREHLTRFYNSARLLGFSIPYNMNKLCEVSLEIIRLNCLQNGYMRPLAFRGCESMLISGKDTKIHVAITTWEIFNVNDSDVFKRGLNLHISKWRKAPLNSLPHQAKTAGNYTILTIIKNENPDFDDALILDQDGFVAEATMSNFFAIKDGELHTPKIGCFLNGITRQTLIQLSRKSNIEVKEINITPAQLNEYDAAFLCGTATEITPIKRIEGNQFDLKNQLMLKLINEYHKLVRL